MRRCRTSERFSWLPMSWKDQCVNEAMANVYNPSGKLCGSITMHCLCILYNAFRHSKLHQPDTHEQYVHLDFPTAIAHLLNRYTNKASDGSKKSKLANQCTTPDRYMQAFKDGLSLTTERFAQRLRDSKTWACTVREFQPLCSQTDVYKQGAWTLRWRGVSCRGEQWTHGAR